MTEVPIKLAFSQHKTSHILKGSDHMVHVFHGKASDTD